MKRKLLPGNKIRLRDGRFIPRHPWRYGDPSRLVVKKARPPWKDWKEGWS